MTKPSKRAGHGAAAHPVALLRAARRIAALVALCGITIASLSSAQEPARSATERSIQAAYLFKVPAYVEWPAERFDRPDSALTIGVLGADDLAEELELVSADRTVNNRPVRVRRLSADDELAGLHVLFFTGVSRSRADLIAAGAATQSILTVTDAEGEPEDSVIDFVTVNGRVRFEVRLASAARNGLRLQSGLLAVAARVHRDRR